MSGRALEYFVRGLRGIVRVDMKVVTVTGLLIRMPVGAQVYRIGGADVYPMVTRRAYRLNGELIELEVPYIPGSSLKGRMRSLLELAFAGGLGASMGFNVKFYSTEGKIWQHVRSIRAMPPEDLKEDIEKRCVIDELFGYAAFNLEQLKEKLKREFGEEEAKKISEKLYGQLAPTRLLVDDFFPDEEYVRSLSPRSIADFLEEKSENRIDRLTAAADPRSFVRVRPGVVFSGALRLLLFDNDDKEQIGRYLRTILLGLKLVEATYLGGAGSRGYGRVRFRDIRISILKPVDCMIRGVCEFRQVKHYDDLAAFEKGLGELIETISAEVGQQ